MRQVFSFPDAARATGSGRTWVVPAVLSAILVAATGAIGVHAVGGLLAARVPAPSLRHNAPAAAAVAATASPGLVASDFAQSALFGTYDPAAAGAASAAATAAAEAAPALADDVLPGELPEAALGLTLRGVVFGSASGATRAIVDGANAPFAEYAVGDTLPGEAIIRHIEARRIVVEHQGELRALSLPAADGTAAAGNAAFPTSLPGAVDALPLDTEFPPPR